MAQFTSPNSTELRSAGSANLTTTSRFAADYDNSVNADIYGVAQLIVAYADITGISEGDVVAELYAFGQVSANWPFGGDGTTGTANDPPAYHLVGVFASIEPAATRAGQEIINTSEFRLPAGDSTRFVLKNVSGQTFLGESAGGAADGWQLQLDTYKTQA